MLEVNEYCPNQVRWTIKVRFWNCYGMEFPINVDSCASSSSSSLSEESDPSEEEELEERESVKKPSPPKKRPHRASSISPGDFVLLKSSSLAWKETLKREDRLKKFSPGNKALIRILSVDGNMLTGVLFLDALSTRRVPNARNLNDYEGTPFEEAVKEVFKTRIKINFDSSDASLTTLGDLDLRNDERSFDLLLGCAFESASESDDSNDDDEDRTISRSGGSGPFQVQFVLPGFGMSLKEAVVEWPEDGARRQVQRNVCSSCGETSEFEDLNGSLPMCQHCDSAQNLGGGIDIWRVFYSFGLIRRIVEAGNDAKEVYVRLALGGCVTYRSNMWNNDTVDGESENSLGKVVKLWEEEEDGVKVCKALLQRFVRAADLQDLTWSSDDQKNLNDVADAWKNAETPNGEFDCMSRAVFETSRFVTVALSNICQFGVSIVYNNGTTSLRRFLLDSPSHFWYEQRVDFPRRHLRQPELALKQSESLLHRLVSSERQTEDLPVTFQDMLELPSQQGGANTFTFADQMQFLDRKEVAEQLLHEGRCLYGSLKDGKGDVLAASGDFVSILGAEIGEETQHWIAKIAYFELPIGQSPNDLDDVGALVRVNWLCQPSFTAVKLLRNAKEVFATNGFSHVSIKTLLWDTKKECVNRLRIAHWSELKRTGDLQGRNVDYFYSKLASGFTTGVHQYATDGCPSWEECSRALGNDLTDPKLFERPLQLDRSGKSVQGRLVCDGMAPTVVTIKLGDAVAVYRSGVFNAMTLPDIGIVLELTLPSADNHTCIPLAKLRLLSRNTSGWPDPHELLLTNQVLYNVPMDLGSLAAIVKIDFVLHRRSFKEELETADQYTFWCRRTKDGEFSPELSAVIGQHPASSTSGRRGMAELRVLDLFSGCGGFSTGLEMAGMRVTHACEWIEEIVPTFLANHSPDTVMYNADVKELAKAIASGDPRCPKKGDIDVVVGGPPCQGFSAANNKRSMDTDKNQLVCAYLEICRLLEPKFILIENVSGMVNMGGGLFAREVIRVLFDQGYHVRVAVVAANSFLPQTRYRTIFIAARMGLALPHFPKALYVRGRRPVMYLHKRSGFCNAVLNGAGAFLPPLTMRDALEDIVARGPLYYSPKDPKKAEMRCKRCGKKAVCNPLHPDEVDDLVRHGDVDASWKTSGPVYICVTNGCRTHWQVGYPVPKVDCSAYARYLRVGSNLLANQMTVRNQTSPAGCIIRWEEPSHTIITSVDSRGPAVLHFTRPYWGNVKPSKGDPNVDDHGKPLFDSKTGEPLGYRGLTPREALRCQSFPDSFVLYGSQGTQYLMIGNAVPPLLAFQLGMAVQEANMKSQGIASAAKATELGWRATSFRDFDEENPPPIKEVIVEVGEASKARAMRKRNLNKVEEGGKEELEDKEFDESGESDHVESDLVINHVESDLVILINDDFDDEPLRKSKQAKTVRRDDEEADMESLRLAYRLQCEELAKRDQSTSKSLPKSQRHFIAEKQSREYYLPPSPEKVKKRRKALSDQIGEKDDEGNAEIDIDEIDEIDDDSDSESKVPLKKITDANGREVIDLT